MTTRNNRYPTLTPAAGTRDDRQAVLEGLKAIARALAINQAEIDEERAVRPTLIREQMEN